MPNNGWKVNYSEWSESVSVFVEYNTKSFVGSVK